MALGQKIIYKTIAVKWQLVIFYVNLKCKIVVFP
jgi:hypothetical protein